MSENARWYLPLIYFVVRLMNLISLPLEGFLGYGDVDFYYQLANIGRPYIDMWVEYPPIFPWISYGVRQAANGVPHIYYYLVAILLIVAEAGCVYYFIRLKELVSPNIDSNFRSWLYVVLLIGTPYGYWYFEPLAVLCMMAGLVYLLQRDDVKAGILIAVGTLIKLFPILAIGLVWRGRSWRQALRLTLIIAVLVLGVYGAFALISPDYTFSSVFSQVYKAPWQTIYALIEGNLDTGNLGPLIERLTPFNTTVASSGKGKIPSYLFLVPFLLAGLYLFRSSHPANYRAEVAFLGLTWSVFLLWSPGWSPQWVLFILPLMILCLPMNKAILFSFGMALINLVEWPLLLTRGYNWGLWLTVGVRTLFLVLLVYEYWLIARSKQSRGQELDW